ncbi:MAG: hypothetical protein EAZ67_14100 [Cytophagales bacterium]|nr:MAG: hypothetical protein EAZ67_14100 [Cytophagales bacterium]
MGNLILSKKSLLSPRRGLKPLNWKHKKEADLVLAVLQTRSLFDVRSLPTEDCEQLGGFRTTEAFQIISFSCDNADRVQNPVSVDFRTKYS